MPEINKELTDIVNRFSYVPVTSAADIEDREDVRASIVGTAIDLHRILPGGREKALALTKLEEAMMWAHAALAGE